MNRKIKTLSLVPFAVALAVSPLQAQPSMIMWEDFEQPDQDKMMAEWPMVNGKGTHLQLTSEQASKVTGTKVVPRSPNNACLEPLGSPGKSIHLLSMDPTNRINGSDKEPLYFSFSIWLAPGLTGDQPNVTFSQRFFTLASWDNENVFSFGPSSLQGLDDRKWGFGLSTDKSGSNIKWTQLNVKREAGWNHLEATIRSKAINFTINGKDAGTFPRTNPGGFGKVIMGSGLPNNHLGGKGVSLIDDIYLTRGLKLPGQNRDVGLDAMK